MYPVMPPATGGKKGTGGTSAIMYPVMPPATGGERAAGGSSTKAYPIMSPGAHNDETSRTTQPLEPVSVESDSWWQTAEAALRHS
jgi:hypothetical protein